MSNAGWNYQLFKDDYPSTQTSPGQDVKALHGERLIKAPDEQERSSPQEKCPGCGKLYWTDTECKICKKMDGPPYGPTPIHLRSEKVSVKVLCPKCGNPMQVKFQKGKMNKRKPFYSCSRYPICKGCKPKSSF
jgi:hypothetical protein